MHYYYRSVQDCKTGIPQGQPAYPTQFHRHRMDPRKGSFHKREKIGVCRACSDQKHAKQALPRIPAPGATDSSSTFPPFHSSFCARAFAFPPLQSFMTTTLLTLAAAAGAGNTTSASQPQQLTAAPAPAGGPHDDNTDDRLGGAPNAAPAQDDTSTQTHTFTPNDDNHAQRTAMTRGH